MVADWEAAASPARDAGIRVVHLRSGLVLGSGGGVLGRLALPARLGVLPRFGDGRQVMSWISLTDEVRAIRFLLDGPGAAGRSGPYNLTAPNPVTNAELTSALLAAFRRPDFSWLRVPAPVLKLGLGEMSSELLTSARVVPKRLLDAGFEFELPHRRRRPGRRAEVASPGREREGQKDHGVSAPIRAEAPWISGR